MLSPTLPPERANLSKQENLHHSTGDQHLTDARIQGNWSSRYPRRAWTQIIIEFCYLVAGLVMALALLYQIAVAAHAVNGPGLWLKPFDGSSRHTLALGAAAVGGACGGFAFALKWLYHTVARGWWNRDRVIWRLVVPLLSATFALFTALMIGSGLMPIFSTKITDGPRNGAAYGFFVGFFSDNLLAALQKVADQILGTLGGSESKPGKRPES